MRRSVSFHLAEGTWGIAIRDRGDWRDHDDHTVVGVRAFDLLHAAPHEVLIRPYVAAVQNFARDAPWPTAD